MKKLILILIAALLAAAGFAYGDADTVRSINLPEIRTELKRGDGREKVETLCSICHSLDYITMQPEFPKKKWTAIVDKMINVMGAPINEKDKEIIVTYLAAQYGSEK
jgi:hypothetical protein